MCFFLEIKEILYKSSSSEALQIPEYSLQNYSSLYMSLVVLNGLWLELVRNVSMEQFILLEQKHFMGTYLSEARNLNLNLLEPKRCCLPLRRIFLQLPGNCKDFCLYNKQKHFVYIIVARAPYPSVVRPMTLTCSLYWIQLMSVEGTTPAAHLTAGHARFLSFSREQWVQYMLAAQPPSPAATNIHPSVSTSISRLGS